MGPSPAARRFEYRLRLLQALNSGVRRLDASDVVTVASLGLVGVGVEAGHLSLVIVGGLLVPLTPIGAALRVLIRGR